MKVLYLESVGLMIKNLEERDSTRLARIKKLFEEYGFQIGPKYIKKVYDRIWELRVGKIRVFLYIKQDKAYGVHMIYKKTQKLLKKDIELAVKRSKII